MDAWWITATSSSSARPTLPPGSRVRTTRTRTHSADELLPPEDVSLEEALIPDYLGLPVCRQILFIGKVSCVVRACACAVAFVLYIALS
jgi:hypothetical protein